MTSSPNPSLAALLAEIEQKLAKISPQPWTSHRDTDIDGHETGYSRVFAPDHPPEASGAIPQELCSYIYDADADFIAAAPRLLAAAARALRAHVSMAEKWQAEATAHDDSVPDAHDPAWQWEDGRRTGLEECATELRAALASSPAERQE